MILCGVDEVGRVPLAGPVISVAYCCNENTDISIAKDSKQSHPKEDYYFQNILKKCNRVVIWYRLKFYN